MTPNGSSSSFFNVGKDTATRGPPTSRARARYPERYRYPFLVRTNRRINLENLDSPLAREERFRERRLPLRSVLSSLAILARSSIVATYDRSFFVEGNDRSFADRGDQGVSVCRLSRRRCNSFSARLVETLVETAFDLDSLSVPRGDRTRRAKRSLRVTANLKSLCKYA